MPDRSGLQRRCQDGVACTEVTARLVAVERAEIELGVDRHHPALEQLRRWARQHADAHRHGADRHEP